MIYSFNFNLFAQGVGINSTGAAPDNSALLDLNTTNKGFLITRVDTTDISSPAFGLMTLAPTDSCLYLFNGIAWIGMGGGGDDCNCNCSNSGNTPEGPYCGPDRETKVVDVTSTTGKVWMDRNLGASQVATSSKDEDAYGDLYQWGRCSDGHEKINSGTTTTLSTTSTAGHGDFITSSLTPADWLDPLNNNLWQGVAGINNPCPKGYRIPTDTELAAESQNWGGSSSIADAFASPLKLPVPGYRHYSTAILQNTGTGGSYWSSTIDGPHSNYLFISGSSPIRKNNRATGNSVRCIKN